MQYDNYPKVLDRVKSNTIDMILIIGCMLLFSEILALFNNVPDWIRAVLIASLFFYEPLCIVFGATIGNDKMQIRVRRFSDESKRINILQSIGRYFFKIMFGWLSFATIFTNQKNRAIHDILSGSIVVKINE